jgi:hypothetical protein
MTFEFTGYARAYEASESKALRLEWNSTEKFDYDGEFCQSGTAGRVCGPTAGHRSTSVAPPPTPCA